MSIPIACGRCESTYRVNERLRGKRVKCAKCGAGIRVAESPVAGAPLPVKRRGRRMYLAIAAAMVVAAATGVVLVGRSLGYFGGTISGTTVVRRAPSAAEIMERDRATTRANLVRIGQSLQHWARFHKGMYPTRLADTLEIAELPLSNLTSPFGQEGYAYLYFRSMGSAMPDSTPVAYDSAELERDGATHVLLASGEVERTERARLEAALARARDLRAGVAAEGEERVAARKAKRTER